jgi:hypothetical protein
VSLAISKDLGRCRWSVLEVSGVGLLASRASFAREPAKAFLSARRSLGPAIIVGVTASESAVPFRATRATSRCGNQLNSAHVLDTKRFF